MTPGLGRKLTTLPASVSHKLQRERWSPPDRPGCWGGSGGRGSPAAEGGSGSRGHRNSALPRLIRTFAPPANGRRGRCSAPSRAVGPQPVPLSRPSRTGVPRHELHTVQQGSFLRALGGGQEPGEWARDSASLERTDRCRSQASVALLYADVRSVGGCAGELWGLGEGPDFLCIPGGVSSRPAPGPLAPTPPRGGDVFLHPELLKGCK